MSSICNDDLFLDRLQQGGTRCWTVFEAQSQLDQLVLQPLPLSMDSPWALREQWLDWSTDIAHRRLVQCFLGTQALRQWSFEALLKQTRPPSQQALLEALERCCFWQIAVWESIMNTWHGYLPGAALSNFGWTFEWIVQALLEREYGALVRRHVRVRELATLGEIDVLALLTGGRSLLVECKSSSKGLTNRQLDHFLALCQGFAPDWALLLIDTDDQQQMQQRMGQLAQATERAFGDARVRMVHNATGGCVVCLREHLFVADTGGGIIPTLQTVLDLGHAS